ncbi:MAG: prepilin-type N-terminal cleavage/methylation domain-containing protein [Curvibacter sp. RIFCSPHIGHO2_12_FULL_63_18]|uniref:PilW family protein n=1 Tax=Rhodoferax sp. TaxID=50421 RepID=UPI0008BDEEE5|nr:PilW family protein [Rhodoferax sp.]OGO96615.1 MAG: prepilin-type N-terminal cleavage/methylation domain-containing protein [Curvibacter sp. GWA2_63_95]OGO98499.1 MAG: prepilin-type N-terminal cleavage/methylation domain-containing protein [Curvibacter sp. RIFCSPHIGHO2_12_FULL_63_18]
MKPSASPTVHRQHGLTLIELLVAMAISLVIVIVALTSLVVARRGFSALDAASQLRDNGRFASDVIQRIAVQAGFKELRYATQTATVAEVAANIYPNIYGFNNSLISASDPLNSASARTAGVSGYGSDILVLRYQALETFPGSGVADGSMINCNGAAASVVPSARDERFASIFHVAVGNDGEPSLMCTTVTTAGTIDTQPLIQGVEEFQVLYGVDGFSAVNTAFNGTTDSVPERYLRADQMLVGSGGSTNTYNNWRRVRSIRIGMIVRGGLNSAQERVIQTLYPFGLGKDSNTGAAGSALSSTDDIGTIFSAPADGRLRQVVTFTVHLRNDQGL